MSRFSTITKKSWKISDNSRIYQNQSSIRQSQLVLPQKFSPQKSNSKDSRIFASSKQRLRLSKLSNQFSPSPVVVNNDSAQKGKQMVSLELKDSYSAPLSPSKSSSHQAPQFASKQSLLLKSIESQGPLMKKQSTSLPIRPQQSALIAIGKIKIEFINFKAQVWRQLMEQKESISIITNEIKKKLDSLRSVQCIKAPFFEQKGQQAIKLLQDMEHPIRQASQVFEKQSLVLQAIFQQKSNQFSNQTESNPQALPAHQSIVRQPIKSKEAQTPIFQLLDHQIQITQNDPIISDEKIEDRGKTSLDRCNQIAQTIGILSQINSSPINSKSKSIEKLAIEEYKQKLLAISKSNQHLRKQPIRQFTASEQQSKLKGNYKLDKFYNAIQKLKEQVNEIRNINDLKQIRKLKILKAEQ